jgi:hypothetical protein
MSISALTSEASQLLDFYRGERDAINAALSAAMAALPSKGTTTYYVDSIGGNNNNPGTEAEPFETLAPVKTLVNERPGVAIVAKMAKGGTYAFPSIIAKQCFLLLDGQDYDPRAIGEPQAVLTLSYVVESNAVQMSSSIYAQSVVLHLRGLQLVGATRAQDHAETPLTTQQYGLLSGFGANSLILQDVDVELNDIPFLDGLLAMLVLWEARFSRGVGAVPFSSRLGRHPLMLMVNQATFPSGESFHDVIEFNAYQGTAPLGVNANIYITDTLP